MNRKCWELFVGRNDICDNLSCSHESQVCTVSPVQLSLKFETVEMSSGLVDPSFDLCRMPKLVVSNVRAEGRVSSPRGLRQIHVSDGLY